MSTILTSSDAELRQYFFSLQTRQDVATLLDIGDKDLIYYLYIKPKSELYTTFYIPKKNGEPRKICAPINSLKLIQRKLNQVLQAVYLPALKSYVQGFASRRSVLSNARFHTKQKYVFNIDLEDFFPSINFGRVRGLFIAKPYGLNDEVATVLAQICCFDGKLPQGAPTSPIVSNMICSRMDRQLQYLAKLQKCIYTRYADDITFSTYIKSFPSEIATYNDEGKLIIGESLEKIIHSNGFEINPKKVRLQFPSNRQEVTGLIVNNSSPNVPRSYIRQIRAMLHSWEKFGEESAQNEYLKKADVKYRQPQRNHHKLFFREIVRGKIEYLGLIRNYDKNYPKDYDKKVYEKLYNRLIIKVPDFAKKSNPTPLSIYFGTGKRHALVIGVNSYDDKDNFKNLKVCVKDAEALERQLLSKCGFNSSSTHLLADGKGKAKIPNRSNILQTLQAIAQDAKQEDLLLFYYSGHGAFEGLTSYLVAKDGANRLLSDTAVSIDRVKQIMKESNAGAKVIIIDACHSGANIGKGINPGTEEFFTSLFESAEGFALLASCKKNEFSYELHHNERSVFTYYLLEALDGNARQNNSTFLTLTNVSNYVTVNVKDWASKKGLSQTPNLSTELTGEICLAVYN